MGSSAASKREGTYAAADACAQTQALGAWDALLLSRPHLPLAGMSSEAGVSGQAGAALGVPKEASRPEEVQPIEARYSRAMRSPLILAIAAALVVVGITSGWASATASDAAAKSTPQVASSARRVRQVPALEEQVLAAINDLRQEHRLAPLRLNTQLAATAREHSLSMAEHGYFSHSSLTGSPFWKRVEQKYAPHRGRLWTVGENLVWASPGLSAGKVLAMWLSSAPHRRNLLTPAWREIGLGAVRALAAPGVYQGLDATIVTADFGVRRK